MVQFSKFINEDKKISDIDRPIDLANSLIRMHNMKSKKTYKFIDLQKYKNRYGNMDGYLYVANSNEGIRINFKNNELHSISSWEKYGSWAPDKTILFNGKLGQKELLSMYNKLNACLETRVNLPYYTPRTHAVCDTVNELLTELGFSGPWHPKQIETWLGVWGITLEQYWNHCGFGEYSDENVLKYTREHLDEFVTISKQDIEWLQNEVAEAEEKYTKKLNGEFEDEDKNDPELVKIDGMDVIKDIPEKVEENPQSVKSDEELANELIADPLPVFRQLNTYALMVARGFNTALLITGQGGVGKSYNVNKILSTYGKKGVDYVIMKGKSSVPAMYKFLYDNYDKIVVFDDCDSVLQNNDGLNILKGVLDSNNVREVSWNTSGNNIVDTFGCETHEEIEEKLKAWSDEHKGKIGVPNYFRFMGACIFISNLNRSDLEKSPSMQALIGRCTAVDIQLMASDIILRIESVLPQKKIYNMRGQDISNPEIKQEVFDFMKSPEFMDDPRIKNSKISFRLFDKIYMFRYAGLQNWKEMAYCV